MDTTNQYVKSNQFGDTSIFSPEVQAALKFNDNGGKNVIVGGQITQRDPGFVFNTGVLATTPIGTPATSPVTTSDPVRDQYAALYSQLNKMNATNPAISTTYNGQTYTNSTDLVGAQRTALESRRAAELARLNSEFDAASKDQEQAQKSETGTSSMGLARIGGFDSASGQAVLTNLERVHVQEQQSLIAKRQAAIQQAQQAYEDKDFALAQSQLDEARKTEQMIYDRQNDFLNNTLKLRDSQRSDLNQQLQQAQFDYQKKRDDKTDADNAIKFSLEHGIDAPFFIVGGVGYDTATGDKLSYEDFLSRGGKPDFSNAQVITSGSIEDKAFVQSLRETYPDAGINSNDTADQATAKIKSSRIYSKSVYVAPVGGSTNVRTSAQSNIVNQAVAAFAASKGEDGYVNPDQYRQFKRDYINAGGTPTDFFQALPVEQYIAEPNRKGDLVGTSLDYQQQKASVPQDRLAALNALSDNGNDLSKLSFSELLEWQKLNK